MSGNIYYDPEDYGLKVLAMAEADLSWEFSMFVVWVDEKGMLFYAEDSGCSCPDPFGGINHITQLLRLDGHFGLESFYQTLNYWKQGNTGVNTDYLRRKVREHMGKRNDGSSKA